MQLSAIILLVIGAVTAVLVTTLVVRRRGASLSGWAATALGVGGLVALVRVGLYWTGLALFTGHADWRQVIGYSVLILNSVVELTLGASLSGHHPASPLLVTVLIVVTSVLFGFGWALFRLTPSSRSGRA